MPATSVPKLIPLLWFFILGSALAQPTPDPGFRAWLWLHGDHPRNAALVEALRELGFHGISAEPSENVAHLEKLGLPWYVDQMVGGDVLAVGPKTWERAREASFEAPPRNHRPACLHDPEVMARARTELVKRLKKFGPHRPAFVSLRDEPSFTLRLNPIDWCDSPASRRAFVQFLENRWGAAARIGEAWGLPPTVDLGRDTGQAEPPEALHPRPTQVTRDLLFHGDASPRALVPWNDTRTFADATFAGAMADLAKVTRDQLPGVPVGFLGGQMPHAFGGFDWERLLQFAQVVETYDHGAVRALAGSIAQRNVRFLSTIIRSKKRSPRTSVHEAWHRYLQGDQEMVVYSSRDVFEDSEYKRRTQWAEALAPALKLMAGDRLAPWRRSTAREPQVAILCSMPSVRLHWLNDTKRDGLSWVNRLTSHELTHSTQARTRESWVALLEDLGLRYVFITPSQLEDGVRRSCKALVLPRSIALSAQEVESIKAFYHGGGLVVADCQTGLYTGHLVRRPKPALDNILGIRRKNDHVLLDGDRILPRARRPSLPYPIAEPGIEAVRATPRHVDGGVPTTLVGTPADGQPGRTLYLNLLILDYVRDRIFAPDRATWLRDEVRAVFQRAGIRPAIRLSRSPDAPTWPITARVRRDGEDLIVALQVNVIAGSIELPWDRLLESAPVPISLEIDGTWTASDVITGKELGTANEFAVTVPLDRPVMLRLRR